MIKSKDITKGTIIEVIDEEQMMFFGDLFGPRALLQYMKIGEQYECLTDVSKKSSALSVKLKQINGNKEGEIFWTFINNYIKILSKPEIINIENKVLYNENEFSLNENEEFVLVKKDNPNIVLRALNHQWQQNYGSKDKNDIIESSFIFNSKSGQRKKFKNTATFLGFLNGASGMLSSEYYYFYFHKNPLIKDEQEYHLHALQNLPDWVGIHKINDFKDLNLLELRKYNTDTRKITSVAIDFNCYEYVQKFIQKMNLTRIYGEGVSKVISTLIEEDNLNQYPYLLSSKFDHTKYKYSYLIPKEKDIHLDLAFKILKLKKKDIPHYNNNGFTTVVFKTEEERKKFLDNYKNNEKIISIYNTNDILEHDDITKENLLYSYKKSSMKI